MAKILLVDDEPEIVALTKIVLEREGHEVIGADDSTKCFEMLSEVSPDLVLMDVMMPGDDGWTACRKIKEDEKTRDVPVAMFTVRTSEASIRKSHECGADAHINKPIDMEELLGTIKNLTKDISS